MNTLKADTAMTNSDAIREFVDKWGFSQDKTDEGFLIDNDRTKQCLSDLTALISEHYVSKEAFDEQKRIYSRLFDEETSCMYCEAKIRRGSAIILCKECAENTEV